MGHVATRLHVDKLIEQAVRLGNHKSKKEAVEAALESYVRQCKRSGLRDLLGSVEFHDDFDDHRTRRRRTGR
jgi:Arc/MetJ family transcription regulator